MDILCILSDSISFFEIVCSTLIGTSLFLDYTVSCEDGSIQLKIDEGSEYHSGSSNQLSRGRVELCMDARFGVVCSKTWDNHDASVACRQLGFSPYGEGYVHFKMLF